MKKLFSGKHPILKVIVIVIIAYLAITFIVDLVGRNVRTKSEKEHKLLVMEDPVYKESQKELKAMKKEPSDIKGMTKYDKVKMGLDSKNGSDSDGDGLTDKEEIEVYKTDPLKMSTVGDYYTDGEKVKIGLNLLKKAKYKGTVKNDKGLNIKGVTIHPATAFGRFTSVNDITGFDNLGSKNVYKEILLDHFDGTVSINLKKAGIKDLKADDAALYLGGGVSKATHLKTEVKGNTISTVKPFKEGSYTMFVVKKELINFSAKITCDSAVPSFTSDKMDGIVYSCPLLDFVSGEPSIRYMKSPDKEIVRVEKEGLVAIANSEKGLSASTSTKSKKIKAASKAAIDTKYDFLKRLFPFGDIRKHPDSPLQLLFSYARLSDGKDIISDDERSYIMRNTVDTGFKIGKDNLPFENISSPVYPGGLCTGFSMVTSQNFNEGKLQYGYGSFKDKKGKTYKWDITDSSFTDLTTKGKLHSFKNSSYADEHTGKDGNFDKNISKEDENFLGAMTAYWMKGNSVAINTLKHSTYICIDRTNGKKVYDLADGAYDYKTVEWMKKQIKSGKIVNLGVTLGNDFSDKEYREGKAGHSINLTAYSECDNGLTIFKVYDCNMPERNDLVFLTQRSKVKTETGKYVDTFIYKYQPMVNGKFNKNYLMTNLRSGNYHMNVVDESTFKDMAVAN